MEYRLTHVKQETLRTNPCLWHNIVIIFAAICTHNTYPPVPLSYTPPCLYKALLNFISTQKRRFVCGYCLPLVVVSVVCYNRCHSPAQALLSLVFSANRQVQIHNFVNSCNLYYVYTFEIYLNRYY